MNFPSCLCMIFDDISKLTENDHQNAFTAACAQFLGVVHHIIQEDFVLSNPRRKGMLGKLLTPKHPPLNVAFNNQQQFAQNSAQVADWLYMSDNFTEHLQLTTASNTVLQLTICSDPVIFEAKLGV